MHTDHAPQAEHRRAIVPKLLATAALAIAGTAGALEVGDRVDDFALLDHNGLAHSLHYYSDARAIVLAAYSATCPTAAADLARLEAAAALPENDGVRFLLVGSGAGRAEVSSTLPVLLDNAGIIAEGLEFSAAGETVIVNPANWLLAHRGGADVAAALADFLAGNEIAAPQEAPTACPLTPERAPAEATYTADIAPILAENCVTCHRQGGIGPWAMTDYNMVRGFAPMIREVIRTRRMPPWHADPQHGEFSNDRSLTPAETRTVVQWVEAGAPRGAGPDPLANADDEWPQWQMGEPDLVLDIPPFDVPASGVVEYQYLRVRNPLTKPVWVRGQEILPGDRSALHHVITQFVVPKAKDEEEQQVDALGNPVGPRRRGGFASRGSLGGYVPGMVAEEYPDRTGTLLPPGAVVVFQMHYTPYGKAVTDRSKFGLYFHDEPPAHMLAGAVLMNTRIRIPPGAKRHSDTAERTFEQDVLVYDLLPHAHYRGTASEFRAFYPDGGEELLLAVPNYDFNWQTTYVLKEPKRLPAGTRVVHRTWWDNSAQNPANPDPTREVPWGRQSWDEMLFGAISYRYLDDEEAEAGTGAD